MAKYDPLRDYLRSLSSQEVALSFGDIGRMVGGLPPSAYEHRAWWANTRSHPNAVAWLDAGWELDDVNFRQQLVRFRRVGAPSAQSRAAADHPPQPSRRKASTRGRRRSVDRHQRIQILISEFGDLLDYYDEKLPFDRSGQYANHRQTIDHRFRVGTVTNALADERFLQALYTTLRSWSPASDFVIEIRRFLTQRWEAVGLTLRRVRR